MNNPLRTILKPRRAAAVALAVVAIPFAAGTASAAPAAAATTSSATTSSTTTPVTSVISIGGYVFYNLTYAEAVDAYFAAVAAAPAGYTPPPVTSVSVDTTVSGTVEG
jgi:hypothetical protein